MKEEHQQEAVGNLMTFAAAAAADVDARYSLSLS
jgi:hypothetical protein